VVLNIHPEKGTLQIGFTKFNLNFFKGVIDSKVWMIYSQNELNFGIAYIEISASILSFITQLQWELMNYFRNSAGPPSRIESNGVLCNFIILLCMSMSREMNDH